METKNYNNLDKKKYPALHIIFEELKRDKEIYKERFDKLYPSFMEEIYNLTKEETAEIILSGTKPITKVNSDKFIDKGNIQRGLEIDYVFFKNGIDAYIYYLIENDEDGLSDYREMLDDLEYQDPNLDYDATLISYTKKRLNELKSNLSIESLDVDLTEYGIIMHFYLEEDCTNIESGSAYIEYSWEGEIHMEKYK